MNSIEFGWSAYDPDAPSETRDNGDPLGLRAWANRISRRLVPIFTPQNRSLWGFPLLCAGRSLAGETRGLSRDEAWLRMETTWVHAQTRHGLHDATVTLWPGRRRAESQVNLKRLTVDESSRLLRHQLTQGSWGAYRRSAVRLGFIRSEGFQTRFSPATSGLTPAGTELARWFFASVIRTTGRDVLKRAAREGEIDASPLEKIPPAGRQPPPKLSALVRDGVERAGATLEVSALRRAFDANPVAFPSVTHFPDGFLDSGQLEALWSARTVCTLVEAIEFGYRTWMLGDPPPQPTIWGDDDAWGQAVADQETEVLELRAAGRSEGWEGVHRWQQELASRRGSRPFERYEVPERYADRNAPTFGLPSLGGLFAEGLFGAPRPDWWLEPDADAKELA